ncbi:hypothetical protein P7K49_021624 [Saguinus oedipus]|uniref:Uncharacterized protein n=1 Tax=Saguinus oedipus TaxID=9490 RepID=A0ABQ9UT82_SAGOE|nr:hypothetical protein P7K49_021624 [Saguinus oedipus]
MAAKPTPAMPAATTTSLTCNKEEGESDSVSGFRVQAAHSAGTFSSGYLTCPLASLAKLRSQQTLVGKRGGEGWMGKELVARASWPEIYVEQRWETGFTQWVFKAYKSSEGGCGKDRELMQGWSRSWLANGKL